MIRVIHFLFAIIVGGSFGFYLGMNEKEFRWWYALILFIIIYIYLMVLNNLKNKSKLCSKGEYNKAIREWQVMKSKSKSKKLQDILDLNIAGCYLKNGQVDDSIKILETIQTDRLDRNTIKITHDDGVLLLRVY